MQYQMSLNAEKQHNLLAMESLFLPWLIAMTSELDSISNVSFEMPVTSQPIIKGA
jgi:hypothetical protein